MLEELKGAWAHSRLDAELVTRICKKLGKLTLRFSMDLITDVSACEYPRGSGGIRPSLLNK